jgi:hypothetical protein
MRWPIALVLLTLYLTDGGGDWSSTHQQNCMRLTPV